jgi:type VI secretion system protein VasI
MRLLALGLAITLAACVEPNRSPEDDVVQVVEPIEPLPPAQPREDDGWTKRVDTSPIDDSRSIYLHLNAEEPVGPAYDRTYPSLHLRCVENSTAAYVSLGIYLGLYDARAEYRIDGDEAKTETWQISDSGDAAGHFFGGGAIPFVKSLLDTEKLVVRLYPYSESPVTMTFRTAGLREHAADLAETCGWDLPPVPGTDTA